MTFPVIRMEDWELIEKDDFWIDMKDDGTQRCAGDCFLYGKKSNKTADFKQFLMQGDIYGQGVMIMSWLLFEVKNKTAVPKCHIAKILKDGNWITGILNERVIFYTLKDKATGKICGWKLRLQTGPKIFTEVHVRKDRGLADGRK